MHVRSTSALALALAACGGADCPPEDALAFDVADLAEVVPVDGHVTLDVRAALAPGDAVRLLGRAADELDPYVELEAQVGDDGLVSFEVPVTPGAVRLSVSHETRSQCPVPIDLRTLFVLDPDATCALALPPEAREEPGLDGYAVLGADADRDGATPGVQARLTWRAPSGYSVRVEATPEGGAPRELATRVVPADGEASDVLGLDDGPQTLRLTCTSPKGALVVDDAPRAVFADADPPGCALVSPADGVELSSRDDLDGDPSNDAQIAVEGWVGGDDAVGELARLSLDGEVVATVPVGADGVVRAEVVMDTTGPYEVTLDARDVAGNRCEVRHDVTFDAAVRPPLVELVLLALGLSCGDTVDAGDDVSPADPGVQIAVRVDAPTATVRAVERTHDARTQPFYADASGVARVTLPVGTSALVAVGIDSVGTRGESAPCTLTLAP